MNRTRTTTANTPYEQERIWLFGALAVLCSSVVLYMYFVSASVVHVVMRKEVDREISVLNSSLGILDAKYIEAQHRVSENVASLQGFTLTEDKIFIDRSDGTLVVRAQ